MDDKPNRRLKVEKRRRQRVDMRSVRRTVFQFFQTHKTSLLTSVLLLTMVVLIFGFVSQLQAPASSTAPSGVTGIDYSTFMGQVRAGNIIATTISGDDLNALLAKPLAQVSGTRTSSPNAKTVSTYAKDYAAWNQYLHGGSSSWSNTTSTATIDPARAVYTRLPGGGDGNLLALLQSKHVIVNVLAPAQSPFWLGMLWRFAPMLLLLLIMVLLLAPRRNKSLTRSMDERMTEVGKSRARRFQRTQEPSTARTSSEKTPATASSSRRVQTGLEPPPVTFADVAGIDEVRTELEEIVQFLRSPERFSRLGARIPRGALLVGPPGTGKTLLAKAVAGEAGVPFFSMSASEFVEMFVGVGASRVRDLFNEARKASPCVIFLDEIDAVGRKRTMRVSGSDERDQTLNQLLVELDGFDNHKAVVVLAATNRVDILDTALLRPGRFDRHITVSLPDRVGREAILRVHTRQTPLHSDVSLERLARLTTGMSGADLANLVNEAALCAARRDLEQLTDVCFEEALARIQLGALRPIIMSEHERRIIAFHEGGHALVAHYLPQADTVNRVTILPRGQSLGVTQFTAEKDRYNYSRDMLMARIAVGLGGRVAEELTFGAHNVTTGAENDLQVVTDLARRMVTRWGMSEQIGVIFADYQDGGMGLNMRCIDPDDVPFHGRSLAADPAGNLRLHGTDIPVRSRAFAMNMPVARNSSTAMATVIDSEVQRILREGYEMACALLGDHTEQLGKLANSLMEYEQLDRRQFEELLSE